MGYAQDGIVTYSETDDDGKRYYFAESNGIGATGTSRSNALTNLRRWLREREAEMR